MPTGVYEHKKMSEKSKEHLSKLFTGRKRPGKPKNWKWSGEQKLRMKNLLLKKYQTGEIKPVHYKHTEEAKHKMRIARLKQVLPRKDTIIEVLLQKELKKLKIKFEKHKAILGQPDIFIKPNICIFADGDYWHSRPEAIKRDKYVNKKLKNNYIVLRFNECDIKNDIQKCISKIITICNKKY